MRFRFPELEILEAAVEQWFTKMPPVDTRRDHLIIGLELDQAWNPAGSYSRRIVILSVDNLNEPEAPSGYLHVHLEQDPEDGWTLRLILYEYDDVIKPVKLT